MASRLKWNGEAFKQHLENSTNEGLKRAAVFLHAQCQRTVGVSNPRNRDTGEYDQPSAPGEAPRKRTGWGQRHIVWEHDETKREARVGVSAPGIYMFWLEIGTKFIARRPWLLATLRKFQVTIGRLAASGGRNDV